MFQCNKCGEKFSKHKNLLIHKTKCVKVSCKNCKQNFNRLSFLNHLSTCKQDQSLKLKDHATFKLHKTGYGNTLAIYIKVNNWTSIENMLRGEKENMRSLLQYVIEKLGSIKVQSCLLLKFIKQKPDGDTDTTEIYKVSQMHRLTNMFNFEELVKEWMEEVELSIDQFTQRGSGWVLQTVKVLEIRIGKLKEHSGGCASVKLPPSLKQKKSLISPLCSKDCFKYSILIALHPINNKTKGRITLYKNFAHLYDFRNIDSNTPLSAINTFERRNNISINVYTLSPDESEKVVPLKINRSQQKKHANLFFYKNHYYCISNFHAFIKSGKSWERFYCYACLSGFRNSDRLKDHERECYQKAPQRAILPGTGKIPTKCKFRRLDKTIAYPYVIYADFEALLVKSEKALTKNTFEYQKHEACSFGLVAVDWRDEILFKKFYRGTNVCEKFFKTLFHLRIILNQHLDRNRKPVSLTDSEREAYAKATDCYVCGAELFADKVLDHCHLTGKFRGAAHNQCNLMMRLPQKIPVVFHNLKGYDAHIIISGLKTNLVSKIHVIPQNTEKYIAIIMDDFLFLDSLAFLLSSLDALANNLSDDEKTKFLIQMFPADDLPFLFSKGRLPYEYMDSWEKFEEKSLPPREAFYSSLSLKTIDTDTFKRLTSIWSHFNCKNLGDFHDIYLKVDVLLLASVFQNFRATSLEQFGLDPCHYFSTPGLTWDASLKLTQTELDLLTDIDMILMFESGIRGGISCSMLRYCLANNKFSETFKENEAESFITYLDVNNLYGYALSDILPCGKFEWVPETQFEDVISSILESNTTREIGYVLEVDLDYPSTLHDLHNDYPLAPEKITIDDDQLSSYQKEIVSILESAGMKRYKTQKLVPNLMNKRNYVVHERNLKFYIEKGLILKKVHRIIQFEQKAWLKTYIEMCTENRKAATSQFVKDFWKLMVNSLYGKSIEDKRKHSKVVVATNGKQAQQQIRKPMFDQFYILDNNIAIMKLRKFEVVFDKPIYLGFTVLDLSKLNMYKLHYDHFLPKYGSRLSLIYTDTDSFIYKIQTQDLYKDLKEFDYLMDFSDYPQAHFLYNMKNKKKLGYLKDEMNGQIIDEVIAIKAKLYAIKYGTNSKMTAKGVQKAIVKNVISIEDYKDCLFENVLSKHKNFRLQSRHHSISSVEINKLSFSPLDDKRYILNDAVSTLAYGHYRITE
uniref:C2H2-type domain-containing protein n=1 Tax=Tetranychus urticae TaxID=32264 RepID=A0A158P4F2_TETUR